MSSYHEQFYNGEIEAKTLLDVIDEKEAESQALREEVAAANDRADTLEHRMMGMMTRHFAEAWRTRDTEKALDGYLSAGIAELERERDAALAEVAALRARVVVVPERRTREHYQVYTRGFDSEAAHIWNACLDELERLNGKSISAETLRRIDLVLAALRSHDFHGIIASTIGDNWREEVDAMRCELRELLNEAKQ